MDRLRQGGEIENSEGSGDTMMKRQLFPVESFVGQRGASLRRAVLTFALALGAAGCGEYGGSDTDTSVLGNGNPGGGAPEGLSVAEQVTAFEATVYPLDQYCATATAVVARARSSRIRRRDGLVGGVTTRRSPDPSAVVAPARVDFHFGPIVRQRLRCWQIVARETAAGVTGGVDVNGLQSDTRMMLNGTEEVGAERFDTGIIARWDFKEQTGTTAMDTSGVAPAMDLTLEGPSLMSAYGIDVTEGRAIATAAASQKLYDRLADQNGGTQTYSVEMWIEPEYDPGRPCPHHQLLGEPGSRNFMLGQTLYSYDFYNRSSTTNQAGDPKLTTSDDDEDLQATLQHVVAPTTSSRAARSSSTACGPRTSIRSPRAASGTGARPTAS
jgi:hypothetical protein